MKFLSISFTLCFSLLFTPFVSAEENTLLELFYGDGCPHCQNEKKWLEELQQEYPDLQIEMYEVWHNMKNAQYLIERLSDLDVVTKGSVPTNIIGDTVIIGFDKNKILSALDLKKEDSVIPEDTTLLSQEYPPFWEKYLKNYSWPAMSFLLGIIDGFNPCAMWSLMILLGFLITMENKSRRWLIGGVFLGSSGLLYAGALLAYLFGFTQISAFVGGSGMMPWLFRAVGILAIVSAIVSLHAYWKNKVECEIRNPKEKREFHKKLSNLLKKEDLFLILPGLILLAFSVNAVELLCSFAIPTAFVATLIQMDLSTSAQLTAIAIYDLAYMLDDIIVFLIAMFTLSYTIISPKMVRFSHLAGGIILLILGYLLLFHPNILASISVGIN